MIKANRILTIFYLIILFVAISIFSALLSTTRIITINDHIVNIVLILVSTSIAGLIFYFVNPLSLRKVKDLLDENFTASSEKHLDMLVRYPFAILPLTFMTELAGMLAYLITGSIANIIELDNTLSSLGGIAVTFLFVLIIGELSQIYVFKIVTNTSASKAIRKLNIIELKSIYIPIKYKLIGVFSIISIAAFIIVAYAVFNNADRYIKQSLYNDTTKSASLIAGAIDQNPNADSILKGIAGSSGGTYRIYLYNIHNGAITAYSRATLSSRIIKELSTENMVPDTQNKQLLFSLHKPLLIDGSPHLLVIGARDSLYMKLLYRFISNMTIAGIFILFIVLITTFLISNDIASHEKKLADYSAALSGNKLSQTPGFFSTDELGMISLNLRALMRTFKESRLRTNENVSGMNSLIGATFKNIAAVRSTITQQSKHTDDLFGIINSIKDIARQITDLSVPFRARIEKDSEIIFRAIQRNKETKSSVTAASTRITRTLKLIEKDVNAYEDMKYTINKLKTILLSVDSTTQSYTSVTGTANTLLDGFTGLMTDIKKSNIDGMELTKDIEVIINETQSIAEGVLSLLSSFLSHIQQSDEMLGMINNVAERTNLLSVNAFILASSPQTEGNNFRVVAEEIKRLAGRARTGSKDISDYITKVRRNVDEVSTGIKVINGMFTGLKQSMSDINSITQRTEELSNSAIDIAAHIIGGTTGKTVQRNAGAGSSVNAHSMEIVSKLTEDISATLDSLQGIGRVFGQIKDTLINLAEINNAHDTTLLSISNAVENIKTFIGYINDSLAIDIKEQVAYSSDSAKELIDHIRNNEQNISDLDTIMNQLIQELDLLKENINLFIV